MKIWYLIFNHKPYKGSEPAFFSKEDFKWAEIFESNFEIIKNELDAHLKTNHRLLEGEKNQKVNNHGWWKTMPLMTWGLNFETNKKNFPKTSEIVNGIPGLVSASFNLLDKNSEINEHIGTTNAFYRVHLGIHIPGDLPVVGFKVLEEMRSWKEGEVFIFCDAHLHSGWNHSIEDRYILLIDIIKPEYLYKKRLICANVLAILALQSLIQKSRVGFYLTFIPMFFVHLFLKFTVYLGTPIYNFFSKITK